MNRWRALRRWTLGTLLGVLILILLILASAWWSVRASRPALDGDIALPGLSAPLSIGRDGRGTVVLEGRTRLDVARGLGFVHAQERYFEMDLTRRSAAGELSALFGEKALDRDRQRRVHRLRARLTDRFAQLSTADRQLLGAYADGVNAGLAAQTVRPWQYLLLRASPSAWTPVDSLLVISEMFFMLQSNSHEAGLERALLREKTGDVLFDFLSPRGGAWDAALDGSQITASPLPGPEMLDLRKRAGLPAPHQTADRLPAMPEAPVIGSNNWAVAGSRTAHGGAILANDMHLGLGVPSIWFRAQFQVGQGPSALRASGVTLPGLPAIVAGSNGAVAWGFTNAYGQWFDWIDVPANAALTARTETLTVHNGPSQTMEVLELNGAPIVASDGMRRFALRWIAHDGGAYNLALDEMLQARHVSDALAVAQRAGMPHQNLLAADRDGQIGWTIAGRLWSPAGLAASYGRFASPDAPRHDWLPPAQSPQILAPAQGQLWTANNRQLSGASGDLLGDGGFDLGARAQQIRDRLTETRTHDETTIGAIHHDDEARFMRTWAERLKSAARGSARHAAYLQTLTSWNGQAGADQAAYRLIRATRLRTLDLLWDAWTSAALGDRQADPKRRIRWRNQFEYSAVQAIDARAAHLLPAGFPDWNALLLAQMDAAALDKSPGGAHGNAPWGQQNASRIQHVLSKAIPPLSAWLDMPSVPQSGDSNLPHVAGPAFGQSERLVVSPGREDQAWLSMPGGQSGHPMSPFYGAGHEEWVQGRHTPLLAGPIQHRITAH